MTQINNRRWLRYFWLFLVMAMLPMLACQTLFGESEDEIAKQFEEIVATPDVTQVVPENSEDLDQSDSSEERDALEEESQSIELPESSDTTEEEAGGEGSSEEAPTPTPEPAEDSSVEQEEETPQDEPSERLLFDAESLILGQYGFIQQSDGVEVAYAFHIENPDPDFGIQDSEYQVAIFDEAGTVLETDFGFIDLVLPSEQTAVARSIWLDEGLRAAEIEIQISYGDPLVLESVPSFAVDVPRYFSDEYSEWATGVLQSESDEYLEEIIVSFVTYDEVGNVSGSGYTYVNWIYPHGRVGMEANMNTNGDIDQIVVYPRTTFSSLYPAYGAIPDDAVDLNLSDSGHVIDETLVAYGLTIGNENESYAVENSRYTVTAYANDGSVIFAETRYIDLIPPGGSTVGGGFGYRENAEEIDFLDYQIRAGEFIESGPIPPIGTENETYLADEFSPTVTGQVVNPFDWDLEALRVWAVLRDEDGNYTGGGFNYVPFVPANGTAAVEIYVDGLQDPASVELIPVLQYYYEAFSPEE